MVTVDLVTQNRPTACFKWCTNHRQFAWILEVINSILFWAQNEGTERREMKTETKAHTMSRNTPRTCSSSRVQIEQELLRCDSQNAHTAFLPHKDNTSFDFELKTHTTDIKWRHEQKDVIYARKTHQELAPQEARKWHVRSHGFARCTHRTLGTQIRRRRCRCPSTWRSCAQLAAQANEWEVHENVEY